jgi:hypothetical protein
MDRVALAAKVTHVPSLLLSERDGALKGRRAHAIESLKEIGRRAQHRGRALAKPSDPQCRQDAQGNRQPNSIRSVALCRR